MERPGCRDCQIRPLWLYCTPGQRMVRVPCCWVPLAGNCPRLGVSASLVYSLFLGGLQTVPDAGPANSLCDEVASDSGCGSSVALRSLLGTCGRDRVAASFHLSFLGGKSSSSSRILKSADQSGFGTEGLCIGERFQFPLS